MSTGYGWEGIRQVCATLLGARHVPERLCGGSVYLGRYNKCSTFYLNRVCMPSNKDYVVLLFSVYDRSDSPARMTPANTRTP